MVALISVDAYPCLAFSDLACHIEDKRIDVFLVALCHMIVRRPNLKVTTKMLLHQQVKIPGYV